MSVLTGLILEKIYEPVVGTNETVRNIRVSVERGSTVFIVIIQHIVTLPKYGHGALNIRRPQ